MNNVLIQVQDVNYNWLTIQSCGSSTDTEIRRRMLEVSRSYPNKRVRAVTQGTNAIVDIL